MCGAPTDGWQKVTAHLIKTSRRFMKNDTSFYGKQHVVFRATIGYLRMRDLERFI